MLQKDHLVKPKLGQERLFRKSMRGNRSKNTGIEVLLRMTLWHRGIVTARKKLLGKPDIALIKQKVAVFCDSEFFHGKDRDDKKQSLQKRTSPDFGISKNERNMKRDHENDQKLITLGWMVIHFLG